MPTNKPHHTRQSLRPRYSSSFNFCVVMSTIVSTANIVSPVRTGDLVVTSGLRHSRFPAGLALGRAGGGRGRPAVEPFAPPDRLEVVKVLRWRPEA